MVDNQHKKITGYRDLTEEEIAMMNSIKLHGEGLSQQIDTLYEAGLPAEWLIEGEKLLKLGIMCLVRAVARPTSF